MNLTVSAGMLHFCLVREMYRFIPMYCVFGGQLNWLNPWFIRPLVLGPVRNGWPKGALRFRVAHFGGISLLAWLPSGKRNGEGPN